MQPRLPEPKFVLEEEDFPSLTSATPTPRPAADPTPRAPVPAKMDPPVWRPEAKAATGKLEVK